MAEFEDDQVRERERQVAALIIAVGTAIRQTSAEAANGS
jgi:hypothetical protein